MTWTETEESAEFWGNVAQGYAADSYETEHNEDDDCEGCDYTPCICHVPQSERWEGR